MNSFPAPTVPESGDDLIDLRRVLGALLRYKWGIVGLAFTAVLIAGLAVYSMEPVYRATASIELQLQQANVVSVEEVYSVGAGGYSYAYTQYEILKSRTLVERVVRKLELHKHPHFLRPGEDKSEPWLGFSLETLLPAREKTPPFQLSEQEQEERAIQSVTNAVAGGLSSEAVQFSLVAHLSYTSTDRNLAAKIVNAVAQEFIDSNLEERTGGTQQAANWLDARLANLGENLRRSEQALQDFRDREGLVSLEGVTSLGGDELQSLSRRFSAATQARVEAKNIMDDVQGMVNPTTTDLLATPAILRHQSIRELKRVQSDAERKVAELGRRYGPKHPKMISAQTDLGTAGDELAKEVSKVVSGINREYELALRSEQQLELEWEARKADVQAFNRTEFELQELVRDLETNRKLYDIFFSRIKSVGETGGFERPHARVLDRALVPGSPFSPNKKLILAIALVLGLLAGCGIAVLLDVLDNTVKSPDDVQDRLGSPLLGSILKQKTDENGHFAQFWEKPQSQYAEAIRTIRTGIVLSGLDDPAKIIVVTSTVPGEGKSTIALNLGAALGNMERTLVIGADLRRPSLAQKCSLATNHSGLSHFVSGAAELEDCIERVEALGVDVMPAGIIPPNPLEMISSKRFADALDALKDRYDRIVVDSAPVQAVSDALILASYADSVIYVVKADSTSATQAKKGIQRIVASNEPLTGVILNQVDVKSSGRYYGSQYYEYGDYHQSGSQAGSGS